MRAKIKNLILSFLKKGNHSSIEDDESCEFSNSYHFPKLATRLFIGKLDENNVRIKNPTYPKETLVSILTKEPSQIQKTILSDSDLDREYWIASERCGCSIIKSNKTTLRQEMKKELVKNHYPDSESVQKILKD